VSEWGGVLIILTWSWEPSWSAKHTAQPDRFEGRDQLEANPNPPCQLSLWEETGLPGKNPRLLVERWLTRFTSSVICPQRKSNPWSQRWKAACSDDCASEVPSKHMILHINISVLRCGCHEPGNKVVYSLPAWIVCGSMISCMILGSTVSMQWLVEWYTVRLSYVMLTKYLLIDYLKCITTHLDMQYIWDKIIDIRYYFRC
jgi:hypothetical protein